MNLVPYMYQKDIFNINYKRLKSENIKCILFDLDNTLVEAKKIVPSMETINLIEKLTKDFEVIIISNSLPSRLKKVQKYLKIDYYSTSLKPSKRNFKKVLKRYSKDEVVLIGDQFVTDVVGSSRVGIKVILVDPLSDDLACTKLNRMIEEKIIKNLNNKKLFFKGKYYE